ncbi:MAG: hypothetical protein AABW73_03965 [Nanoarchaeota archaeon]
MKKGRNSKEVIESTTRPDLEAAYRKYPGEEPYDVSEERNEGSVRFKQPDFIDQQRFPGVGGYREIHTHPSPKPLSKVATYLAKILPFKFFEDEAREEEQSVEIEERKRLPSWTDIDLFLLNDKQKSTTIAARDPKTGKLRGYFVLRKTKWTRPLNKYDKKEWANRIYSDNQWRKDNPSEFGNAHYGFSRDEIRNRIQQYAWNHWLAYRQLDEKGRTIDSYSRSHPLPKKSKSKLETTLSTASLTLFLVSLIFLSSNITGNVISGVTQSSSNILSISLFLAGLICAFFYFKNK